MLQGFKCIDEMLRMHCDTLTDNCKPQENAVEETGGTQSTTTISYPVTPPIYIPLSTDGSRNYTDLKGILSTKYDETCYSAGRFGG